MPDHYKSTDFKYHFMNPVTYQVVDLFCGCGGISRGFERTGRYSIEAGVEVEPHPIQAFAANHHNSEGTTPLTYCGDILKLVGPDAVDSLTEWLAPANLVEPGKLDVLVGGPPCQGFSRNGVRQYSGGGTERFYDDPRNHLYRAFMATVAELRPKILLIENVREFLNFDGGRFKDELLERLDELGYVANFRKVCAADYGVPQMRHRVIFLAVSRELANPSVDELPFPSPTFFPKNNVQLELIGDTSYRTVRDAISDLPNPTYDHKEILSYTTKTNVSEFALQMRSNFNRLHNHVARVLSESSLARVNAVGTGRMKSISETLKTRSFYGSAYRRLAWDEPALTITTWVYHVGSGRYAHPTEDRAITMREAARLQSFDDDFIFPKSINPVSQMIGNAVPPLMAEAFGKSIAEFLDKHMAVNHIPKFQEMALG